MNYSKAIFLINDTVRAILGQYEPEDGSKTLKQYVFKTMDATIKVDDLVVVPSGTRYGMTVMKVIKVDVDVDFDDAVELKWAVQKVDQDSWESVLAQEDKAPTLVKSAEKTRQRNQLREALITDNPGLASLPISTLGAPA